MNWTLHFFLIDRVDILLVRTQCGPEGVFFMERCLQIKFQ